MLILDDVVTDNRARIDQVVVYHDPVCSLLRRYRYGNAEDEEADRV